MVSADRIAAAKRAEIAARIEEGVSMALYIPLIGAVLGVASNPVLAEGKAALGTTLLLGGLFGLSWRLRRLAAINTFRAQDLLNEEIPSTDKRVKLYKTPVHKLAHDVSSRRSGQ